MKKKIFKGTTVYIGKSFLLIVLFIILAHSSPKAQIYYSNFSSPSNHYETSAPSGVLCLAPNFENARRVADTNLNNYSSVSGLLSLGLLCSGNNYSIRASIALPEGVTQVPAGYYAGFRVRLNTLLNLSVLQRNIMLRTYLGNQIKETTSGTGLLGLSLLASSTDVADLSFLTTQPFDAVEIILNTDVISLGVAFNYQFFYAFAANSVILPVKLTSFTATAEGKKVNVSWATASEENTAKYELERSNDGGVRFITVGSITAKGTSSGVSTYNYTDASVWNGNYMYRLKMIDKDGSIKYSKLVSVKLTTTDKWKAYPTLLSSGATLHVSVADDSTGKIQVQLVTLQGQTVRSIATGSSNLSISTYGLATGLYILKLYQNGQFITSKKVSVH
jgi:hypothetical protein